MAQARAEDEGVEYELNLEEYSTHENVRGKRLRIICMEHPHDVMPAIFFFHGAGGQAEQWKEQLKYFHNRGTLVAVDMVGHGRSEVSSNLADYHPDSLVLDLVDVFLRYKRQHNVIIAHSYGTSLAARAYAHVKDSVTACVFVGPSLQVGDAPPHLPWWLPYAPDWALDTLRIMDRRGGTMSNSVRRMVHASAPEAVKAQQLAWNAHTPSRVVRMLTTQMRGATAHDYAAIAVPVCLFVGLNDHLTVPARAQAIKDALDTRPEAEAAAPQPSGISTPIGSFRGIRSTSNDTPAVQTIDENHAANHVSASSNEPIQRAPSDMSANGGPGWAVTYDAADFAESSGTSTGTAGRAASDEVESVCTGEAGGAGPVCELHVLRDCGHQAMVEKKEIVNAYLMRFLLGVPGLHVLDRLHTLNRGDSITDKWALKNFEKWSRTQAAGAPIRFGNGKGFVPMKVMRQDDAEHSPAAFMQRHPSVQLVLDLTSQAPPYETADASLPRYIKLSNVSKKVPGRDYVALFIQTVDEFYASICGTADNPILIAVHCHYAFNRTGFMICCYLVERAGFTVNDALAAFKASRPPGIKHQHFIDELHLRYSS